jgi:hypothetical protein
MVKERDENSFMASWPRSYYATILSKYSGFQVMLANNELTPIPIYIKWSRRRTQEPPSVVQACYTNPRNLPPATGTAQRSAMLQIGKTITPPLQWQPSATYVASLLARIRNLTLARPSLPTTI